MSMFNKINNKMQHSYSKLIGNIDNEQKLNSINSKSCTSCDKMKIYIKAYTAQEHKYDIKNVDIKK